MFLKVYPTCPFPADPRSLYFFPLGLRLESESLWFIVVDLIQQQQQQEKEMEGVIQQERSLAETPTYSVASVVTVMVFVCLLVERSIYRFGKVTINITWLCSPACFVSFLRTEAFDINACRTQVK